MFRQKKSLADILIDLGCITRENLNQAREFQKNAPGDIGRILKDLGFASERDVASARAAVLGVQFVDLSQLRIEPEAVQKVPEHIIRKYDILPIRLDTTTRPNKLMVAICDVQSSMAGLDDIKRVSRCHITPVFAAAGDIRDAIERCFGKQTD